MATLQRQQQSQHIKSQPMNQQATQQAAHLQSNGQPQRMPLTNLLNDLWEWKGDIEGTIRSDELDKYDLESQLSVTKERLETCKLSNRGLEQRAKMLSSANINESAYFDSLISTREINNIDLPTSHPEEAIMSAALPFPAKTLSEVLRLKFTTSLSTGLSSDEEEPKHSGKIEEKEKEDIADSDTPQSPSISPSKKKNNRRRKNRPSISSQKDSPNHQQNEQKKVDCASNSISPQLVASEGADHELFPALSLLNLAPLQTLLPTVHVSLSSSLSLLRAKESVAAAGLNPGDTIRHLRAALSTSEPVSSLADVISMRRAKTLAPSPGVSTTTNDSTVLFEGLSALLSTSSERGLVGLVNEIIDAPIDFLDDFVNPLTNTPLHPAATSITSPTLTRRLCHLSMARSFEVCVSDASNGVSVTACDDGSVLIWPPEPSISPSFHIARTLSGRPVDEGTPFLCTRIPSSTANDANDHSSPALCASVFPRSGVLAAGNANGALCVWKCIAQPPSSQQGASANTDGEPVHVELLEHIPNAHKDAVWSVAFHSGGDLIATAGADDVVSVWGLHSATRVRTRHGNEIRLKEIEAPGVVRACWSQNKSSSLTWGTSLGELNVCDLHEPVELSTGKPVLKSWHDSHEDLRTTAVRTFADSELVQSCHLDGSVRFWDSRIMRVVMEWGGHEGQAVMGADIDFDNRCLVTGSIDGVVRIFDLRMWESCKAGRGKKLWDDPNSWGLLQHWTAFQPFHDIACTGVQVTGAGQVWVSGSGPTQVWSYGKSGSVRAEGANSTSRAV